MTELRFEDLEAAIAALETPDTESDPVWIVSDLEQVRQLGFSETWIAQHFRPLTEGELTGLFGGPGCPDCETGAH